MSYTQSVAEELLALMPGLGKVTTKKMFGALGFYQGPIIFAFLFDGDIFYLKATDALADELKAQGSQPLVYKSKSGKTVYMPYWTAPLACLDDADEMVKWVKKALASAASDPKPAKPAKKSKLR